jgi:peptidylprolyl isomerase
MAQAKNGDKVKVHYTGTLDDGSVFDSSIGRDPLEFTLGGGQMIPGFDKAVEGMSVGESKTIRIPCEEAYGARDEERMLKIERSQFPPHINPEVGQQLQLRDPGGHIVMVVISEVGDEVVTLDGNHPLAGQALNFDLQLAEIA